MNISGYYCPRCEKRVYFAEEIIAMGKHWHKSCFLCANPDCRKRLDSRTCADREGEAYCIHCYRRSFGPKGYGFGVGSGTLSMDGEGESAHSNVSSFSLAQVAPAVETNVTNGHVSPRGSQYSPRCTTRFNAAASDLCRRCGKPVYLAEKMIAGGSVWHKLTCFNCAECKKRLESINLCEKNEEIYCKTCYARNFGPKGYGYGIGAGTLQMQQ